MKIEKEMKRAIAIISSCMLFVSCKEHRNYSQETIDEFNSMTKPVVLLSKSKSFDLYGVQLIDGTIISNR